MARDLAGGVVLTVAAMFNPIGPSPILISGVGESFGLNCGFRLLPGFVADQARGRPATITPIPFSLGWTMVAVFISLLFIAVIGQVVRF